MDHDRLGRRTVRPWPARRALGGDPLALDQQNGLVGLACQPRAVAFDEHVEGRLTDCRAEGKNNMQLLETTHYYHRTPVNIEDLP